MKSTSGLFSQVTSALVGGLLLLIAGPSPASAQVPLALEDGTFADMEGLRAQHGSRFRLFGEGDRAATGMRATGQMEFQLTNTGIVDGADLNWDTQPDISGCALCSPRGFTGFDFAPLYAAGRVEWVRFLSQVPSLLNATGGGAAVSRNFPTLGVREILASDLQFGVLVAGVVSTEDGGCQDFGAGGRRRGLSYGGRRRQALILCEWQLTSLARESSLYGAAAPGLDQGFSIPGPAVLE